MILFEIKVFEIFVDLDNFAVDIRWKKCGKQPNICCYSKSGHE